MIQEFLIQTHRLLMISRLYAKLVMIKKRQICKECKETGYRFDARKIPGNHYPFYEGEAEYDGCVGCYQYDPIQYRKTCNDRIYNEGHQKGYYDGYQIGYHQKTTL